MLTITDTYPDELLEVQASQLHEILNGPTLIHLPGTLKAPLFISVLMHGNEETGFLAIQQLLKEFQGTQLPRSLSIFIGNIAAAKEHVRKLDSQPDYNRIWAGYDTQKQYQGLAETHMMQQVLDEMSARQVFASIDIHNTSGHNPHYACINHLEHSFLQLANLFGRKVVFFTRPKGVQTMAFAKLCPAVTLECGQVIDHDAVNHALSYLKKVILLEEIPPGNVNEEDIDLFQTTAIAKVPDDISIEFGDHGEIASKSGAMFSGAMLNFSDRLDDLNFREIPAGTVICRLGEYADDAVLLDVQNSDDVGCFGRYLKVVGGEIRTKISLMPAMLSMSEKAVRLDCLCYFMERVRVDGGVVCGALMK